MKSELLEKNRKLKTKVEELESAHAALQSQLAETQETLTDVRVNQPLRKMAAEISDVPELWLSEFEKVYKLQPEGDTLLITTQEGKTVNGKDGKPIPFSPQGLFGITAAEAYTDGSKASDAAKKFKAITRYFGPSGGISSYGRRSSLSNVQEPAKKDAPLTFGLR